MKVKIKNAIISLSDKSKIDSLIKILMRYRINVICSGGTYKKIIQKYKKCEEVSKFTGFKEMLDGRVKSLHPKVHAGILHDRQKKSHRNEMNKQKFPSLDLIVVNFYPFQKVVTTTSNPKHVIENIDIGGPTMVRAAAKNYNDVTILTSPHQYLSFMNQLNQNNGSTSLEFRKTMSRIAFTETAYYDSLIANYFNKISNIQFPKKKNFSLQTNRKTKIW